MLIIATMILALLSSKQALSQKTPLVISGKVISDDESYPLEGATIAVKGTQSITGTMPDGAFTLSAAPDDTLIISLSGYETRKIKITKDTYYEVALKHSNGFSLSQFIGESDKSLFTELTH